MQPITPNPWWGSKSEPDLRSLYEWLDQRLHQHSGDRRGGLAGGIIGGFWGLMGGAIGIMAGALQINPAISVTIPVSLGFLVTAATGIWYMRSRTDTEKAVAQVGAEMRNFLWKLVSARWQGNIKGLIGEEAALALNKAAYEYLQCRTALNSPAWQAVGSESPWAIAREKTGVAMEVAMSRLVTMIGQGARADEPAIESLLADMQRATAEASATASRLASHHNLPTDAANELRKALSEMRALNAADEEFSRVSQES